MNKSTVDPKFVASGLWWVSLAVHIKNLLSKTKKPFLGEMTFQTTGLLFVIISHLIFSFTDRLVSLFNKANKKETLYG